MQEAAGRVTIRRRWTVEEKRRMVEASLSSSSSVAQVARHLGLNANQLFSWRKLYLSGQLESSVERSTEVRLLPVSVTDEPKREPDLPRPSVCSNVMINIELPGRALISVEGQVSTEIVRAVLESLRG